MKRVAFASHVALIKGKEYDGIGNAIIETLSSIADDFTFIRHSMDGLMPSEVRTYHKSKISRIVNLRVVSKIGPLRYITEVVKTVYFFVRKDKVDVYIGIDPLNALAGILLKKLHRVDTAIFYTADYSPSRFNSGLMNRIYHWIDVYCVRNADEVWSVSSKIVDIRRGMGLSDVKNVFLPNVPPVEFNHFRNNTHDKFNLIMYGIVDTQLDFEGAIRAVAQLKDDMPKISLTIVGNGPQEEYLKKVADDLSVADRIRFMGRRTLKETLELASRSGIGLALYTGEWGFNQYGDSTKCREYFNFGLPVISTDTHSTVGEIVANKAGIIVRKETDEYITAIQSAIARYDEMSLRSLSLGKKYEGIHQRALRRVLGVQE